MLSASHGQRAWTQERGAQALRFVNRRFTGVLLAAALLVSATAIFGAVPAQADGPSYSGTVPARHLTETVTFTVRETTPGLAILAATFEPSANPPEPYAYLGWQSTPDGTLYAQDRQRSAIVRWRPGEEVRQLFTHPMLAQTSTYLAATNGQRFAVGQAGGGSFAMNVFDVNGRPVVPAHPNVEASQFVADGRMLVGRSRDQRSLLLWDLATNAVRPVGRHNPGQWGGYAVSATGRFLAAGGHSPQTTQEPGVWVLDLAAGGEHFYATSHPATPRTFFGMDHRFVGVYLDQPCSASCTGTAHIDRATGSVSQPYWARNPPSSGSPSGRFGSAALTEASVNQGYATFEVFDFATWRRRTFRVDASKPWLTVAFASPSNDGLSLSFEAYAYASMGSPPTAPLRGTLRLQAPPFDSRDGDVLRLYRAFFQREPDRDGAFYWTGHHAAGLGLGAIADGFVASAEFANAYQGTDDPAYVDRVYRNVLNRAPDPSGRAYWVDKLAQRALTRGGLMVNFSVSEEFRGRHPYTAMPG